MKLQNIRVAVNDSHRRGGGRKGAQHSAAQQPTVVYIRERPPSSFPLATTQNRASASTRMQLPFFINQIAFHFVAFHQLGL